MKRRHIQSALKNDNKRFSQRDAVREHLKEYGRLDWLDAFRDYGIKRLAARIHEVRQSFDIETETVELQSGKEVAEYHLKSDQEE